jgi:hypothetical protein
LGKTRPEPAARRDSGAVSGEERTKQCLVPMASFPLPSQVVVASCREGSHGEPKITIVRRLRFPSEARCAIRVKTPRLLKKIMA